MNDNGRKLTFILGTVAAVAGVAVASYLYFQRSSQHEEQPQLRNVSEILTDCYAKMNELQRNLAALHPQPTKTAVPA